MAWLKALLIGLFQAFLGKKQEDAELYGEAVQRAKDDKKTVVVLNKELQAQADAPNTKAKVQSSLRKGVF